jgi:hypothetical protein
VSTGDLEAFRAETEADREAIYRFRYSVYVQEMGRYRATADHDRQVLIEPEDSHSVIYGVRDATGVAGTLRATFGADGFSPRQISQYSLDPFLAEIPAALMVIGERMMIAGHLRGTTAGAELREPMGEDVQARGVRIVFGDCEPHLLSLNLAMGCLTYAERNISSDEAGYLIPVVSFPGGTEGLAEAIGSPGAGRLPSVIERIFAGTGGVISPAAIGPDRYWERVHHQLDQLTPTTLHAFAGFDDDEIRQCVERSNIIDCAVGDRVLKKEGSSHNLFVVLDGALEVREGDKPIGLLAAGDVFGEMAFLLGIPRQRDVIAATDNVRILSLSEGNLRKLIATEPTIAAKLLLNISKMLCGRLIRITTADGAPIARSGTP